MTDEVIPDVALVDNTSQRLPCVLVLDGSSSMADSGSDTDAIRELNAGLKVLASELQGDDIASQRDWAMTIASKRYSIGPMRWISRRQRS